jgi:hypothetical protein
MSHLVDLDIPDLHKPPDSEGYIRIDAFLVRKVVDIRPKVIDLASPRHQTVLTVILFREREGCSWFVPCASIQMAWRSSIS